MSNIHPTNHRAVFVEGFDNESDVDGRINLASDGSVFVDDTRQIVPSSLGIWLEFVALGLFLFASFGTASSVSLAFEKPELLIAMGFVSTSVIIGLTVSDRAGDPAPLRASLGIVVGLASLTLAVFSFIRGGSPNPVWPSAIAMALAVTFWALIRLTGETAWRCFSFGAIIAIPLLLGFEPFSHSFDEIINQSSIWLTSTFLDMASIAYGVRDFGFEFVEGKISSLASINNYAGILGPIGLVLAVSVAIRQSLVLTVVSGIAAIEWWLMFRGLVCLYAVQYHQLDGTWDFVAMPIYSWFGLLLCIVATQAFLSSFFAPLPLDNSIIEHSVLSQLYNMAVSFPQTGPRSQKLFSPYVRNPELLWANGTENSIGESTAIVGTDRMEGVESEDGDQEWELTVKRSDKPIRKVPSKNSK